MFITILKRVLRVYVRMEWKMKYCFHLLTCTSYTRARTDSHFKFDVCRCPCCLIGQWRAFTRRNIWEAENFINQILRGGIVGQLESSINQRLDTRGHVRRSQPRRHAAVMQSAGIIIVEPGLHKLSSFRWEPCRKMTEMMPFCYSAFIFSAKALAFRGLYSRSANN